MIHTSAYIHKTDVYTYKHTYQLIKSTRKRNLIKTKCNLYCNILSPYSIILNILKYISDTRIYRTHLVRI